MKFLFLIALFSSTFAFAGPREAFQELRDGIAVFIDVRESDEVKLGMIKGAMWIPLSDMEASTASTISLIKEISVGKKIYIYCRSGRRSQIFINHMSGSGLTGTNLGAYEDLLIIQRAHPHDSEDVLEIPRGF